MKNNTSLTYSVALLIGDFTALLTAFATAYLFRVSLNHTPISEHVQASTYITIVATLLPFFLIVFALLGLYNARVQWQRFEEFGRLILGCFIGITGVISYSYLANVQIFPARLVTLYGFLLAFSFVLVFRTILRALQRMLFRYGIGISNVLLVGDTSLTTELVKLLADTSATGYRVIGIVSKTLHRLPSDSLQFASFSEAGIALNGKLHTIIQTELYALDAQNDAILVYAQEHHLDYRFIPGNNKLFVGKIETELFHSIPLIAVHQTALVGWGRVIKRATDVVVSLTVLVLLSPLLIAIALAIRLSDKGPIFFRQIRLTRGNREFRVYKFRSHYMAYSGMAAEEAFAKMGKPELAITFRKNGNQLENDPRVTPIGNFIRRTSIDELPQLFNVLNGDISLVGPRALVPADLAQYAKRHTILSVKSGITGLAQVSGRNDISLDERRRLDVYYVQNWSFWGDIVILVRTAWVVLHHRNAR
jgi:exopolysaccharide biosynthesis polyprenyl glycosylphosphotransferase